MYISGVSKVVEERKEEKSPESYLWSVEGIKDD